MNLFQSILDLIVPKHSEYWYTQLTDSELAYIIVYKTGYAEYMAKQEADRRSKTSRGYLKYLTQ